MLSLKEAQDIILAQSIKIKVVKVPLSDALGCVLAQDILADRDYPPFNRAAMDGYAIRFQDYVNNNRTFEIVESIFAGQESLVSLGLNQCYKIMTGAAVPASADAVVRIEDTSLDANLVTLAEIDIKKGMNIASKGEDANQNSLVVPKNTYCNEVVLASLAAMGYSHLLVYKMPKVAIVATGNELVPYTELPNDFQIRNSNSVFIEIFLKKRGIVSEWNLYAKDNLDELEKVAFQALNADIVIFTGGVSAGEADFLPQVLEKVGVKKQFHKVQIKPGKPLWFGTVEDKVVFSLPGNPISVQVAMKLFVEPFIRKSLGLNPFATIWLPLAKERIKKVNLTEIFPAKLILSESKTAILPVSINGSGDVVNLNQTDGIAIQHKENEVLAKGTLVEFFYW